jgi:hypothetical protein
MLLTTSRPAPPNAYPVVAGTEENRSRADDVIARSADVDAGTVVRERREGVTPGGRAHCDGLGKRKERRGGVRMKDCLERLNLLW